MVKKCNSKKFETIQCPKEQGVVALARTLAERLETKSEVPGATVPMYGAVKWALELALKSLEPEE